VKTLVSIVVGCALGAAFAVMLVRFGPQHTGLTIAVLAALVLGVELVNAVRR
jgi:hypothetical protein